MIKQKQYNTPEWKECVSISHLPESLSRLTVLSKNIWYSWNPRAKALFDRIDSSLFEECEGNPVKMLQLLSGQRIEELLADEGLMAEIDAVCDHFESYMSEKPSAQHPSVAYFSMEYGLTATLKIYSGGLGVLAGDYLKEASDSNVPLTAVGFLYRYGYFDQSIAADGQQMASYDAQNFHSLPLTQVMDGDKEMTLEVPMRNHTVFCHVWRVDVGRIELYLLDTDLDMNSDWDKQITHKLYGGDWENRLKQEYLLGVGGIMLLDKLGIKKDVYHMNEGHAAFINLQRLADYVEHERLSFDLALELVRASSLYTVHTPVPAGHDYFDAEMLSKYLGQYPAKLGISWQDLLDLGLENPGSNDRFSMSVFALNTCQEANGVSKLHGELSKKMFAPVWKGFFAEELHVSYVTNGVHLPTWAAPAWQEFFYSEFGGDFLTKQAEEATWEKIQSVSDSEIWQIRKLLKEELISYVKGPYFRNRMKSNVESGGLFELYDAINPDALLIGFARRFATYKRAHLLFTDLDRLEGILNDPKHPVQFVFAGKAHPADGGGQGLIKHITEISKLPQFEGKIIFLENYDMNLASKLIAGVDVWLNTPTRPLEASGTSGEKAEMNGVLNLSVLDGWWYEGYREGAGWALTDKKSYDNQQLQDKLDAVTIYELLEREVIPLYFDRNDKGYSEGWLRFVRSSMNFIAPNYTMRRMLNDYFERFYNKLSQRSARLQEASYALARDICTWKAQVAANWDTMKVANVKYRKSTAYDNSDSESNSKQEIALQVDMGMLECELEVELILAKRQAENDSLSMTRILSFTEDAEHSSLKQKYFSISFDFIESGKKYLAVRIRPKSELLPHAMDFAYVKWVPIP